MDKKKNLIKKLSTFKEKINKEIPIHKMILFGSRAYGKPHKWSDFDLMVISTKFKGKKTYKRARRLYDYWNLDYPVDFLCFTPEEFNKLKKQTIIVKQAIKKGIEI